MFAYDVIWILIVESVDKENGKHKINIGTQKYGYTLRLLNATG